MKYYFTGKNLTITDSIKERATNKLGKLEKLFQRDSDVHVTFSVVKHNQTVEVTIPLPKRILRAEVTSDDLYTAIDEVVDKLEKQMIKYKNQLQKKSRKDTSFKNEFDSTFSQDLLNEEHRVIEKTKRFALKPMDAEEAVMEMELLGHGFYVFRNAKSEEINVVYKRKDGSYGLIEPEC